MSDLHGLITGARVRVEWADHPCEGLTGECGDAIGEIVETWSYADKATIDIVFDHEPETYRFELGQDGSWYEVNNCQAPTTIEVITNREMLRKHLRHLKMQAMRYPTPKLVNEIVETQTELDK